MFPEHYHERTVRPDLIAPSLQRIVGRIVSCRSGCRTLGAEQGLSDKRQGEADGQIYRNCHSELDGGGCGRGLPRRQRGGPGRLADPRAHDGLAQHQDIRRVNTRSLPAAPRHRTAIQRRLKRGSLQRQAPH